MDGTWIMPAVDAVVVALLAAVLWRLRRDPHARWEERERRLEAIFERLRLLIAQSEGAARGLDGALGAHQQRWRALVDEARAEQQAAAPAAANDGTLDGDVIARVRTLAAAAMPIEEIARRVDMPAAEVRVLVGLRDDRRGARGRTRSRATTTAVHA